jgi:D-lactate dehydrogenase (cytochrome)
LRRETPDAALAELKQHFGARCSTANAVREHHGRDESPLSVAPPDAVVFAEERADVQAVLRIASRYAVPVIPYGAGSSLEGHVLAVQGGISLDLSRMARILRVDSQDLTATVECGVTRSALNEALRDQGLFFPIDPGADASIGGMCATRASGTNAVRYGTMRENVLALGVVDARGQFLRTGTRARKSSSGYDLTRLLVGSEGTLGVITEATLRLYPLPEAISAASCSFPSIAAAVETAIRVIQFGIPIARCELMDATTVMAVNRHSRLGLAERPMLLMEFHGSHSSVKEQAQATQELAQEQGGDDFVWAERSEERSALWRARHQAFFATLQLRPGCRAVTTDFCVPISRLADCIEFARTQLERTGVRAGILGHVGDGNFHIAMLIDPAVPAEQYLADEVNRRLTDHALALEGTCTGEHGIGLHKMAFFLAEHAPVAVEHMRAIKGAFDPQNILNPGKIFTLS